MDSTTMKGTVQGYFDRAFDEMTDKELETPLTNSGLGVKAKLAPNSGTFVQFRKFGDLALATEANSDSPTVPDNTTVRTSTCCGTAVSVIFSPVRSSSTFSPRRV